MKAGRYLRLSMLDSGTGMDEATLARAAEPFFTTKGIGKGTGLGLSMVHGLAEQSGGKLRIVSAPGNGTTIELWLPVAVGGAVERPAAEQPRPERPCGALRVLAVDDDALVLMNTAMMLEDLGHSVAEASSGRRALEILAEDPSFDLVITDQAMPGMTGVELANAVLARQPKLPLLATGYAEIPDVALPRLAKPFDQQALAAAIERATGATTS